ncbi:MAG: DUF669 domain-containing protein [Actinomycetia bacterium]|jgi:hypothetical protein|nr:DUF669 domain-containing protein [Actinomycetes bacterium]
MVMNFVTANVAEELPVRAGKYKATVMDAELKNHKKDPQRNDAGEMVQGAGINIRWSIIEGEFDGRAIFDNITYRHANATAQGIGHRALKALCEAVDIEVMSDPRQLVGKTVIIETTVRRSAEWGDKAEVKAYHGASGYAPPSGGFGSSEAFDDDDVNF